MKILDFIKRLFNLLFKTKEVVLEENEIEIDWSDVNCKISEFFTVGEATLLPSWQIYHIPSEEEKQEIVKLAQVMDIIRKKINKPCYIHCWIRPKKVNCPDSKRHGQDYNVFVGSVSKTSGHIFGQAVDFHFKDFEGVEGCEKIRELVKPMLEELNIRMEDKEGSWVHIDTKEVGYNRFFKP